jgi:hypothetical protein
VKDKFSEEERIPDGERHERLLELGGSLRGKGVPEEKIVLALRWINENLCDPSLEDREFEGIVKSVKKIKAEINALVDDFEAWLETQEFKGKAGATDKKVVKTLLKEARKYGKKGVAGLDVAIAGLDLKDRVGVGYKTVRASIERIAFIKSTPNKDRTKASTITILYPKGAEVNEDGELVVLPFVRQGDNSYISSICTDIEEIEANEYLDCPPDVQSRWGAGRLGPTKADFLNLIIKNIGVRVPFEIADLHFVNQDYDFKRRHLSDLAKPKWGFVERKKHGVYMLPEDIVDIYQRYKEGSGEAEAQERERAKTQLRRLAYAISSTSRGLWRRVETRRRYPFPRVFRIPRRPEYSRTPERRKRTAVVSRSSSREPGPSTGTIRSQQQKRPTASKSRKGKNRDESPGELQGSLQPPFPLHRHPHGAHVRGLGGSRRPGGKGRGGARDAHGLLARGHRPGPAGLDLTSGLLPRVPRRF